MNVKEDEMKEFIRTEFGNMFLDSESKVDDRSEYYAEIECQGIEPPKIVRSVVVF